MDTSNAKEGQTPEQSAAQERESSEKGFPASGGEQFSPSKELSTTNQERAPSRAGRSSGPITKRGKERSRLNALTHGIFATVVLLKGESSAQFDALLQGFRDDFRPEGTAEEILVQKLATLTWRYRRMLGAERAEIEARKRYGSRDADREKQNWEEATILYILHGKMWARPSGTVGNPLIHQRCMTFLNRLKSSIETRGFDPYHRQRILAMLFGDRKI